MSKATAYSSTGTKKEAKASLPKEVFGLEANHDLLSLSYRASQAELREAGAKTLRRGEVRGGGKKPWRQKGTGRARVGSSRNPVWRGGGIAFGPIGLENHRLNLNVKAKRSATAQALSAKAAADQVLLIENIESKDGKTAPMRQLLNKIGAQGRILLVVDKKSDLLDRATRNLEGVEIVTATYLNVRNTLDADTIVFTKTALDKTSAWLSGKKPEVAAEKTEVKATAKPKTEVKK